MNNNLITDDVQKQRLDQLMDLIIQRSFERIAHVLTDEDIQKIDELDKEDTSGQAVRYYLISKVPNFEAILQEEATKLKSEV